MENDTMRLLDLTNANLRDKDANETRKSKLPEILILANKSYSKARVSEWGSYVDPMVDLTDDKVIYDEADIAYAEEEIAAIRVNGAKENVNVRTRSAV